MNSQIFKTSVAPNILTDLLEKICSKNEKYYILNKTSYKKGEYLQILDDFYNILLPYYYESKKVYLTRKHSYNTFVTIVRQLCRINNVDYTSKIKYNKSTYDIIYYIYY